MFPRRNCLDQNICRSLDRSFEIAEREFQGADLRFDFALMIGHCPVDGGKDGVKAFAEALPVDEPWGPKGWVFSESDVKSFVKLGKHVGYVGSALEMGTGIYEVFSEGKDPVEVVAKAGGGMAGAWALGEFGAGVGAVAGPPGAFAGALIFGTAGAFAGEAAADKVIEFFKG